MYSSYTQQITIVLSEIISSWKNNLKTTVLSGICSGEITTGNDSEISIKGSGRTIVNHGSQYK